MINNKDVAVKITGVSKKYILHHEKPTLAERLATKKGEVFDALKNVNLEIHKGENVGIIGPNGSGKTTLLKIITGITSPTKGKVETFGNIVSLIDLEAGFHPDLTGEQNIFLNGMLLGLKKRQLQDKMNDIIGFSGLQKFIDTPLYTYSEGMKLRLGLSIAINADPDILILDENIYTSDLEFQIKVEAKLDTYFKTSKTVIVVSHWLDFIRANCKRTIRFERGRVIADGKSDKIITAYKKKYNP